MYSHNFVTNNLHQHAACGLYTLSEQKQLPAHPHPQAVYTLIDSGKEKLV